MKPPPRRARPTIGRLLGVTGPTLGAVTGTLVAPLSAIAPLRDLPVQKLVSGSRPVLGWHGGRAPYRCQWLDRYGETLAGGEPLDSADCVAPATPPQGTALAVSGASGVDLIWRAEVVAATALPRPHWLAADAADTAEARAAWAIWLWREGGIEWRLQALAMLGASREFLVASVLLDSILAESPRVTPE